MQTILAFILCGIAGSTIQGDNQASLYEVSGFNDERYEEEGWNQQAESNNDRMEADGSEYKSVRPNCGFITLLRFKSKIWRQATRRWWPFANGKLASDGQELRFWFILETISLLHRPQTVIGWSPEELCWGCEYSSGSPSSLWSHTYQSWTHRSRYLSYSQLSKGPYSGVPW